MSINSERIVQFSKEANDTSNKTSTVDSVQGIVSQYGPPAYENDKGKLSKLNEPFWSALFARENIVAWEPDEQSLYRYQDNDGLYEIVSEELLRSSIAEQIFDSSQAWGEAWFALQRFRNSSQLSGIIDHLKGQVESKGLFDCTAQRIVHLKNCVLAFEGSGEFVVEKFSPNWRSRNQAPIKFDAVAKCPNFEASILGHLELDDRLLLQKYAGQCLLGRNVTQRLLLLDGTGGASKGAFILCVQGVVGALNTYELRTEHLDDRFEIGRMLGKTLLLGSDVKSHFLSSPGASRLKALVGGDTLEAEKKGSNRVKSMHGVFNVIITSNSRLRVRLEGDQSAWRRRFLIVRYDRPFTGKKIPDIHLQLLQTEASGILNWMLQGLQLLFKDIESTGDVVLSERQHQRIDALSAESDSLLLFLRHSLAQTSGPDLTTEEILEEYAKFCIARSWDMIPTNVAERQLTHFMLEIFGSSKSNSVIRSGRNKRGFSNVQFRKNDDES
jgi:putative DNA primase/helicase